jgi:hypothetical protein
MVVMMAGARPSLEGATCTRTLCADGSLLETVRFKQSSEDAGELSQVGRWVDTSRYGCCRDYS